jgi:hypothetical protein
MTFMDLETSTLCSSVQDKLLRAYVRGRDYLMRGEK